MTLRLRLVAQFARPRGPIGHLAGWVMAARSSNRRRNRWLVDLLEIGNEDFLLEIGCGPGLALTLALQRTTGPVVGLDHSQVMISQAASRNRQAIASGRLDLVHGGLDRLAAMDRCFDTVYSINVVQFLPDQTAAFAAIHARLPPGGVVATAYMPRHKGATRQDAGHMAERIGAAMIQTGFGDLRTEWLDVVPVPAMAVIGRR